MRYLISYLSLNSIYPSVCLSGLPVSTYRCFAISTSVISEVRVGKGGLVFSVLIAILTYFDLLD